MFLVAVLAAAVFAGPPPERGTLRGEVAVEAVGAGAVVIFVDTNGDASFDHRFMLDFEPPDRRAPRERDVDHSAGPAGDQAIPTPLHFDDAIVDFDIGYVRVAAGGNAFEAFVEGTQSAAWNPAGSRVWRRAGYGLSHHAFETGVPIRHPGSGRSIMAEYCDASSNCDPGDTGGDGGGSSGGNTTVCDSGGPGSTTCSISGANGSCSVTCSGSYYACCIQIQGSAPRCKCARS
jgi:hypothetical protein